MIQKDIQAQIAQGRQYLKWVVVGACLLAMLNVGMGILYDNYLLTVLQQLLVVGITATLGGLLWKGKALRWYFFAWLILAALGFFFQGGQRMIFQVEDGGLAVYVSVLGGLGLIGLAIFLGGSDEIGLYLDNRTASKSDKPA
jgi:hypothetical protein